VAVTPTTKPGVVTRLADFVTDKALLLIGLLLLTLLATLALSLGYVRRLKAASRTPGVAGGEAR